MTYNIHPIFVHFPIALLFIYSVIKILPMDRIIKSVNWRPVERIFLFLGLLGAMAALMTGETAEHLIKPNHQLVEAHSTFAGITFWLYALILLGEILNLISSSLKTKIGSPLINTCIYHLERFLTNIWLVRLLALIAVITLAITGLLGGVIVYGTNADPLANIVLQLLNINL